MAQNDYWVRGYAKPSGAELFITRGRHRHPLDAYFLLDQASLASSYGRQIETHMIQHRRLVDLLPELATFG